MTENKKEQNDYIDLRVVAKRIWERRKLFYVVLPTVFVVTALLSLCIPRYYKTDIKLVPEIENSGMEGTLGSLASSFGIDLTDMQTSDAITPLLYPDLMEDNGFVSKILSLRVKSAQGADVAVDTTYYAYLKKYQQRPWWQSAMGWVKKKFKSAPKFTPSKSKEYNPYMISEEEFMLMEKVRDDISISVDKKTAIITIDVKTQDPYICMQLAEKIKDQLQIYITNYRTNKARTDLIYYEKLAKEAKREYDLIRQRYAYFSDANADIILESIKSTRDDLENEMQLKYNAYSTIQNQLQAAKAKVQERTPAFTLLKGAMMPVKHAGPKRMFMVIGWMFFAFVCTVTYIFKEEIINIIKK